MIARFSCVACVRYTAHDDSEYRDLWHPRVLTRTDAHRSITTCPARQEGPWISPSGSAHPTPEKRFEPQRPRRCALPSKPLENSRRVSVVSVVQPHFLRLPRFVCKEQRPAVNGANPTRLPGTASRQTLFPRFPEAGTVQSTLRSDSFWTPNGPLGTSDPTRLERSFTATNPSQRHSFKIALQHFQPFFNRNQRMAEINIDFLPRRRNKLALSLN